MVLHVFTSFLGGVPLCIPYGLYSGTSLGGTTRGILGEFPGRVLSMVVINEKNELLPTITVTGWRICIDYRRLNKVIRKDHFPLAFID